ncbi:hypothetical protein EVAR_3187_1 [Eumeta japonica]|uniref:Uncharacterized protein n=1 Tax=Eumeta variegata TaxID=151549 RepID=A0A4C1XJU8_EUMVA|nr:hypothetical protein EVAR_3187_1 [Eumeta japonica]
MFEADGRQWPAFRNLRSGVKTTGNAAAGERRGGGLTFSRDDIDRNVRITRVHLYSVYAARITFYRSSDVSEPSPLESRVRLIIRVYRCITAVPLAEAKTVTSSVGPRVTAP